MIRNFEELERQVRQGTRKRLVLAMAEEEDGLKAAVEAAAKGVVEPVLVGHEQQVRELAARERLDIARFRLVHAEGEKECAARAVELLRAGEAEVLMKGRIATSTLMKGVLDTGNGLRGLGLLSHLTLIQSPAYPKLIFMSDPGLNIAPDLNAKVGIIENAVRAARKLGVPRPKVAVIAAVEKVNPGAMPATVDAAALAKMAERGQIADCLVDGPLSLDNALSARSCEVKGIGGEVGGDADILLMPDIEAANVFYKAVAFFSEARMAGVVVGARVPIVLPSRADSDAIKYDSILAAIALA
jgi:phosphate butyryltransferase